MSNCYWGIIAPGNIAAKFAAALREVEGAVLYSVASRDPARAKAFAKENGFAQAASSYQELINDPKVDVIYIASPHNLHAEQSMACLRAGKPVLCEKPMTVNQAQALAVTEIALEQNVFYMEAVWTRFLPVYQRIRQWLDAGEIGDVKMIQAGFGFNFPFDLKSRLYDPNLAGGALLDVGIYPITFAQWVMQDQYPLRVSALGSLGASGVDECSAVTLQYADGQIATLTSTVLADTVYDAWIIGSKGKIKVPMFWCAESAQLIRGSREDSQIVDSIEVPHQPNGYEGEIKEVQRCLAEGAIESPSLPWSSSVQVMQIMDEVRSQLGLVYPFEDADEA